MIGFVGLSHLGIVSSIAVASKGFKVIAYDPRSDVTASLQRGEIPVHEVDLPELLERSKNQIQFTSTPNDLARCQVVVVSIDVKTNEQNLADITELKKLINELKPILKSGTTLVVLSQSPLGFTRSINEIFRATGVEVYHQVETLIFGRAVERALKPERYIIGCEYPEKALPEAFQKLLAAFDCPLLSMRYESAELAKMAINMYLVSSVSTTNTLAEICENVGAEWSEIAPALRLDKRIGQYAYLGPGLGIAGGNLERDLIAISNLSKDHGTDAGIIDAWLRNSQYRRDWALRTVFSKVLSKAESPRLAVWGLAYKAGTHSIKNSPSLAFLSALRNTEVSAYDPQVKSIENPELSWVKCSGRMSPIDACSNADALAVLTPWDEFKTINLLEVRKALKGNVIIDPYSVLDQSECRRLGFEYYRLGSPQACNEKR
jgi:UDPglucose 6-dehydrogenase